MSKNFILAIDGPAGAGKSTIAKKVAKELSFAYLDTGAMYRAVTLKVLEEGGGFTPEKAADAAGRIRITFRQEKDANHVFMDGRDVSEDIRSAEVTGLVSKVAAVHDVRTAMVAQQRLMGQDTDVVLDGRDIGTVVFPNADLKIFLTASAKERARRRGLELEAKGQKVDYEKLQKEIEERDRQDASRADSPLKQADDAVLLDTSDMDIPQVTKTILEMVEQKRK